jgi:hypothetical protein
VAFAFQAPPQTIIFWRFEMKNTFFGILIVSAVACQTASAVDTATCKKPDKPAIPAAETVTEPELLAAQKLVKTYTTDGQQYLECLKGLEAANTTTDEKQKSAAADEIVGLYNTMVDDMHAVADSFNQAVRVYKTRAQK